MARKRREEVRETVEEYRTRMFRYVEGKKPLAVLSGTAKKVEKLLSGLPAGKTHKRPAPGKWSISEILAHIADTELVSGCRIRFILGEPGSPLAAFDQDAWAAALHYERRDVRKALEQFRIVREGNLELLKSLKPKQWKQHGLHAERGPQTIETIVKMLAGHDINHTRQIEAILGK